MNISNYIIPLIIIFIVGYGIIKKVDIFDIFLNGVKEGLDMSLKIFPTIFAISLAITILLKSNVINLFINLIEPLTNILRIPKEIIPLGILRPISGTSSLMILNNILINNGPDSYVGRIASVIQGSSDTTIYIIGLYFGSVGIKKIKYSLLVGLLTDFICILISIITINILF